MAIKFLKKGIRSNGRYIPVWYSMGGLYNEPKGTITIYAREYNKRLPKELSPENFSDMQTDYFEKDRARIRPRSKYYQEVIKAMGIKLPKLKSAKRIVRRKPKTVSKARTVRRRK